MDAVVKKPQDYKSDLKPVWCPGCGDYSVLASVTRSLAELDLDPHTVALISGIGCSSRLPAYSTLYGFHAVHGRALPVATGLKLARPDLTVLVAGGDGDGFSIGGNHFVHACRRNVDMTYIVMDNSVYGMTKGQASPTTESTWTGSKLTPEGPGLAPFRPLEMALSAGATFIARAFAGDPLEMTRQICAAIAHPGFSFIHVLSPCVTYRPEQKEWRTLVHAEFTEPETDRKAAFLRLLDDDGFSTGILLKSPSAPFRPTTAASEPISALGRQFAI
ncbi:2-oxoacid:ferredoxin oxidoreductase subunit beta [Roseospira marina]|uniref:2-oxoacid:ferredoxin oxidoreductase subunit beta n=1 Tax=Roseospira marina TaxID=140057 RepID=A0A5M6IFI2_9PROT|nr:2-oxoacid:ferredoxin oxidoreductase subunit beta [Roseospira marina]KAA5606892.1 2-oxoacid:ferredoxin oxidoreductase subunit beta [Roseospira marina]MBB4312937.1 2-oxoglutarate ferredoxin oxidoreductase subunit beta [Roseospira marina]MBB5086290.1 2-oxoglutarate ferredoxin oxidoreductase subunit beta [Roseospira marina]